MVLKQLQDYTKDEIIDILDTLSDAINICDESGNYGTGDKLLDIIHMIKYNRGIDMEDYI